jgi:iron complex transport system permease protein
MSQLILKPIPRLSDLDAQPEAVAMPRLRLGARPWVLVALVAVLVVAFVLVLIWGSVSIPTEQVLAVLAGGEAERASWTTIVQKFRVPKAVTAVLAGAALAASGLMMQTLFRNPLASPDVLGINSGASLGVAVVVLWLGALGSTMVAGLGFLADLGLTAAAALGAGLTLLVVLMMARRVENSMTLLILGLMVGNLTFAMVSLMVYFSVPERVQAFVNWGLGSFAGVTLEQLPILGVGVGIGLLLASMLPKTLNALLLGEAYAASLGLNPRRARLLIILTTALLTGTVTVFCGPIGFVGVAVPHLCRSLLNTSDHRLLMPAVLLMGGAVGLVAAVIAEVPGSTLTLPLNAVMAFFGAPVVIAIVLRQRNLQRAFAG